MGLYTAAYLWIYIAVIFLKRFVHPGNFIFLPLISAFGILLENLFIFFLFFVRHGYASISASDISLAGRQMLWGFFLIPIFLVIIEIIHLKCEELDAKKL
ncbi:MAG: hypothetical protein HQK66_00855 [Desulfamplus sp.]|nr:hypothetical protein [Desulfamplus sp.]